MGENDWNVDSTTACKGVRIKYQGNVLYSAAQRTTKENADACYAAMAHLIGVSPDEFQRILPGLRAEGLVVEAYTSS